MAFLIKNAPSKFDIQTYSTMKTNPLCPIQLSLDNHDFAMPLPVVKIMTYLQAPASPGFMESPTGVKLLQDVGSGLVEEWMKLTPFPLMPDLLVMQFRFIALRLHLMVMLTPDDTLSLQAAEREKRAQFSAAMRRLDDLVSRCSESPESFRKRVHPAELEEQQALAAHFLKTYENKLEERFSALEMGFCWAAPTLSYPIWDIQQATPQVVPPVGLFFRSGGTA